MAEITHITETRIDTPQWSALRRLRYLVIWKNDRPGYSTIGLEESELPKLIEFLQLVQTTRS